MIGSTAPGKAGLPQVRRRSPPIFQQTRQELFEKAEEARKLAREADEKTMEARQEVETAREAFRESGKKMEEARRAVILARKTLADLEGEAAEARQEVMEARRSVQAGREDRTGCLEGSQGGLEEGR